jgi:uncharacterized protein
MVAEIELAGHRLVLLPERAAWLPEHRLLLVADAHIGKAVSFRRLGVPVPQGTTTQTLQRLDAALQFTQAQHIIFLGDLLHSARALAPATRAAVQVWRDANADIALTLVRGNHDDHAGDPPAAWRFEVVNAPLLLPALRGLALAHHPQPLAGSYTLAGHVHPAAVLGGRAVDRLRLPCFHFGAEVGVLPAFGAFTGMHVMPRGPGDRVFVVTDDTVRALHTLAP